MSAPAETISHPPPPAGKPAAPKFIFGFNEMRLRAGHWLVVIVIVIGCVIAVPRLWKRYEPFHPGLDYRIPYALSRDYWLYQRRLEQVSGNDNVYLVGDSVVWGEYVRPDGTLSHFLDQQTGQPGRFLNCGVNGLFPLAMEGLLRSYGDEITDKKVIVHCNLLWLSSPRADLSEPRAQNFNHSRLVPQFMPRIPSYDANASERISAFLDGHIQYFAWTNHLQSAYYGQHSLSEWTLEDDGNNPPKYPNAWRSPFEPLRHGIPKEPANDPERGPTSRRHKPWNAGGAEPSTFEWVPLDHSLQWQAFQHVVRLLRHRGNQVLVIIGPFNRHMIAPEQQPIFDAIVEQVKAYLSLEQIPFVAPPTLPSELYADASHPLTEGYRQLSLEILGDPVFGRWMIGHLPQK